jgi:glycosyltransferase involved in cell wall biosynthesis
MRVVCLSDATLNRNGVGSYYSDLMDHLKDTIEHAELICPEESGGRRSYSYTLTTSLPGDPTQRVYFPKVHSLLPKINRINPDVIITPTPGPYGLTGYGLSKCIGANLCVGYHTQYDKLTDLYWKSIFSEISRMYMKYYNRLLFSASDIVVANSDEMIQRAVDDGAHTVQMIGTPIAKTFLNDPITPLSREIRSVCFCGRLTGEKNLSAILTAVEQLQHIRFTIAGDGPLRNEVTAAAKRNGNLRYVGWVGRNDVKGVIDGADMMILPSKVESFGTIALEAMARGRWVLVSENCGIVNWPDLRKGVYVIGKNETLSNAIRRVSGLDESARIQKAHDALLAARAFNAYTIRQWTDLFTAISRKSALN